MRLAIISDTHMPRGARAIPELCLQRCREADAILHAGDLADLSVLEALRELGPPVHAISGNVDNAAVRAVVPQRTEKVFGTVRVGMKHIPGPANGRLDRLRAAAFGRRTGIEDLKAVARRCTRWGSDRSTPGGSRSSCSSSGKRGVAIAPSWSKG